MPSSVLKKQLNLILLLIIMLAIFGCGSGSGGGGGGGDDEEVENATTEAQVSDINLNADKSELPADGKSNSTIEASAVTGDEPASNVIVNFSSESGDLSNTKAKTNDQGIATVVYTAPDAVPQNATDTITASVSEGSLVEENISENISIKLLNTNYPAGEEFGISAEYLNISGLWKSQLQNKITINQEYTI